MKLRPKLPKLKTLSTFLCKVCPYKVSEYVHACSPLTAGGTVFDAEDTLITLKLSIKYTCHLCLWPPMKVQK